MNEVPFWKINAPEIDTQPAWVYMDEVFNDDDCDNIIKLGHCLKMTPGTVYQEQGAFKEDNDYRKSMVSWIAPSEETAWIYKRLSVVASMLNNDYYQYDIDGFAEGLQFTEYTAPTGMHRAHSDKSPNGLVRKMTLVVQLSSPDSYEGCDLQVIDSSGDLSLPRTRGTLVMFPSWSMHQVTDITKGKRNSLVGWITGRPLK